MLLDPNETDSTMRRGWPKTLTLANDVLDGFGGVVLVARLGYNVERMKEIYSRAREVAHMRMTGSMGDER